MFQPRVPRKTLKEEREQASLSLPSFLLHTEGALPQHCQRGWQKACSTDACEPTPQPKESIR